MAISDKLMDIRVLVEKYLDQDELDELYELTEDIKILVEAKNVELSRFRAREEANKSNNKALLPDVSNHVCPINDRIRQNKCIYRGDKCRVCLDE